jgi:2Fe-2S ferredoxin
MPLITVLPENKTVNADAGATLLKALIDGGIALLHKCEGKAQCGACHISLLEGRKGVSKVQKLENEKLDSIVGVGSKSRLACQVVLGEEPVTVELLSAI